MENDQESDWHKIRRPRAEIDTRAPFRSVKEAVMLFGERVLVGKVYANKLNQMRNASINDEHHTTQLISAVGELEETKQNLEKAREESQRMANSLISLKDELEKTKLELIQLKARESNKQFIELDIEDLKLVENDTEVEIKIESSFINQTTEFRKKRSVKFVNPPTLAQIINPEERALERQISVDRENEQKKKKKKKKKLMPLISAIFTKKKSYHDGAQVQVVSYA